MGIFLPSAISPPVEETAFPADYAARRYTTATNDDDGRRDSFLLYSFHSDWKVYNLRKVELSHDFFFFN